MAANKQRISRVSADVMKPPIRSFKVIVVGDPSVGKTCLTFRFCDNKFVQPAATVGLDLREKEVIIDNEPIKLIMWDTAGQERFRRTMISHYYRHCNAVIFVYDVTRIETFKSLHYWLDECRQQGINLDKVPCILVGNKCDCVDNIAVTHNMAMIFADRFGMPLFETSAYSDSEYSNVEGIFMTLAHKLKSCKPFGLPVDKSNLIVLHSSEQKKNEQSWCCVMNWFL